MKEYTDCLIKPKTYFSILEPKCPEVPFFYDIYTVCLQQTIVLGAKTAGMSIYAFFGSIFGWLSIFTVIIGISFYFRIPIGDILSLSLCYVYNVMFIKI